MEHDHIVTVRPDGPGRHVAASAGVRRHLQHERRVFRHRDEHGHHPARRGRRTSTTVSKPRISSTRGGWGPVPARPSGAPGWTGASDFLYIPGRSTHQPRNLSDSEPQQGDHRPRRANDEGVGRRRRPRCPTHRSRRRECRPWRRRSAARWVEQFDASALTANSLQRHQWRTISCAWDGDAQALVALARATPLRWTWPIPSSGATDGLGQ